VIVKVRPRKGAAELAKVRYRLDGKKVRAIAGKPFAGRLNAARLTAGKHRLVVRVKTRAGEVRTFKVRLQLA
jgi:hypothetical protein